MASPFGGLLTSPESAFKYAMHKAKGMARFGGWALPAAVGGGWLIWPALSDGFKVDIGLLPDPEQAAAQAEAASKLNAP